MSFSLNLSRKQFLAISAASAAVGVLQACSGDDAPTGTGGAAGTGGSGGSSGSGGSGQGGAGTGGGAGTASGSAGQTTGGTGGSAGTGGSSAGTGGSAAGTGGSAAGTGGSGAGTGGSAGTGTAGAGGSAGTGTAGAGGSAGTGTGDGGMGGEDPMGGGCDADISVMSSGGQHQHSLLVTAAQIAAGTDVTILSGMSQSHSHQVKITAADFTALKAGMEVKKKSCAGGDHEYVLKCGGGGSAPVVPTDCTDECGGPDAASACP